MIVQPIAEVRIVRRTTRYNKSAVRDQEYVFSEVLITTVDGRHFCSRLWHEVPDTAFARAEQAEQFRLRMRSQ